MDCQKIGKKDYKDEYINNFRFDKDYTKKSMIITSLVHFIFIKDLEKIEYNFGNASYLIKRENINMFFNKKGFKVENLLEDDNWTQHIKNELKNKEFIKNFFEN